jgi:cytochrome c556
VADSAAAIVESGAMLLAGDRLIDKREWLSYTQRFMAAGKAALAAANAKKADGIFMAGGDLNETCDACHEKYQRQ